MPSLLHGMRSFRGFFFLASLLGFSFSALAQGASERPRTVAGVCGSANWVCVAECIEPECVDRCLREGCEQALDRLKSCTLKAGCAEDDTQCAARTCGPTCQRAFEPAPPSPEKELKDPCQGQTGSTKTVPGKLVGEWRLTAASLPEITDGGFTRIEPQPRADYARTLRITPEGCFVLRTALKDATLGQGNALVVRAWGMVEVLGEHHVKLLARDGQAVGPVCGAKRVIPLARSKVKFRGGSYRWDFEQGALTLTLDDATKQTFQFEREEAVAP
ncbi:hypothetical protein [Myxococcus llanfairpwllgwyngyllgogerychwyrndrobwllllantysiliogogogochensis]|uniref:hypothetical protein n=1 Tax=Myxococcus llanfairpwllgwyngyllgogerychwyrndrobwllllantysiliogogogochensis TaxID=2590453 RepID=UPI001FE2D572|nr:hypothetical protein [Myxococcus llanfairpwllgwyngyllgogerychwyrndrobwllllantysiliogogogochensis]